VPFLTVYAKRVLAVNDGFIGTLVSVTLTSSLLSNLLWARLCDRRGNGTVIIITTIMGLAFCAAAAFITGAPAGAVNTSLVAMRLALILLFAVSGAMLSGINLVSNPLMIEIASPAHQSLYMGLGNTILGVVLLLTSLVGVIVDRFGYAALFVFCGVAFVVALERMARMQATHGQGKFVDANAE
jgi:MFS family permease